jgi:hypothetical protein
MHVFQKPIRRDLAAATGGLSFLVSQGANRGELQTHSDRIDEGRHCTWPRPLDHSGRKIGEVRLFGQIDLGWRLARLIVERLDLYVDPDALFDVQIKRIHGIQAPIAQSP